jgi:hypothetical protein
MEYCIPVALPPASCSCSSSFLVHLIHFFIILFIHLYICSLTCSLGGVQLRLGSTILMWRVFNYYRAKGEEQNHSDLGRTVREEKRRITARRRSCWLGAVLGARGRWRATGWGPTCCCWGTGGRFSGSAAACELCDVPPATLDLGFRRCAWPGWQLENPQVDQSPCELGRLISAGPWDDN